MADEACAAVSAGLTACRSQCPPAEMRTPQRKSFPPGAAPAIHEPAHGSRDARTDARRQAEGHRGAAAAASQKGTSGAGTFGRLGPLFAGVPATQPEDGLPCGGLQASNARHWVNSVVDGMGWQRHEGEPSRYRAGPEGSSGTESQLSRGHLRSEQQFSSVD